MGIICVSKLLYLSVINKHHIIMQNSRVLQKYSKKHTQKQKDRRLQERKHYTIANYAKSYRPDLITSAYNAYASLDKWRTNIVRNEEFVFGDQHSDVVFDWKDKRYKTERQMFVEQGLQPSQYNIVRNILRTMTGVWGSNKTLPTCVAQIDENQKESEMLTATLHVNYRKQDLWKFDLAQLMQLAITGVALARVSYADRENDSDVVTDFIDPFNFFVDNSMKDSRYKDCTFVGMLHDMSVKDISSKFSKGSKKRATEIEALYAVSDYEAEERVLQMVDTFTESRQIPDFFTTPSEKQGLGRVVEIWRKESEECFWVHDWLHGTRYPDFTATEASLRAENERRIAEQANMGVAEEDMLLLEWDWGRDTYWKYYFLTTWGDVLDEGINPFWHEKPPIIFEFHDFYLGKIYPFIKDIIDANKQINKLSAISELLVKYSAKSTTFVPVEGIADEEGFGLEYIEQKMTDYDSIIPYKSKHMGGQNINPPQHINTVGEAFTPMNIVSMYLKLSENISGVYGALQGAQPTAGTPAAMYAQQTQNSATSLVNLFESIGNFKNRRDKLIVQTMQQFYSNKRYLFDKDEGAGILYDPERVRNVDFLISISENTNTPAYRLMVNDMLMQLKQFDPMNQIDLRGMIEVGNLPFKEKLLDYLNQRDQEMGEAQAQGLPYQAKPIPADVQQGLQNTQFNPELQNQFANLDSETQNAAMSFIN